VSAGKSAILPSLVSSGPKTSYSNGVMPVTSMPALLAAPWSRCQAPNDRNRCKADIESLRLTDCELSYELGVAVRSRSITAFLSRRKDRPCWSHGKLLKSMSQPSCAPAFSAVFSRKSRRSG